MEKLNSVILLAGRFLISIFFVLSGINFLTHYQWGVSIMVEKGIPGILLPPTILLLIGGGLAIMVGWRTRIIASILAVFTLVAGIIYHNQLGDPNEFQHFMKNLSIVGGYLCLVRFGAGEWSLDNRQKS